MSEKGQRIVSLPYFLTFQVRALYPNPDPNPNRNSNPNPNPNLIPNTNTNPDLDPNGGPDLDPNGGPDLDPNGGPDLDPNGGPDPATIDSSNDLTTIGNCKWPSRWNDGFGVLSGVCAWVYVYGRMRVCMYGCTGMCISV